VDLGRLVVCQYARQAGYAELVSAAVLVRGGVWTSAAARLRSGNPAQDVLVPDRNVPVVRAHRTREMLNRVWEARH